jgi:hypothetical protein
VHTGSSGCHAYARVSSMPREAYYEHNEGSYVVSGSLYCFPVHFLLQGTGSSQDSLPSSLKVET